MERQTAIAETKILTRDEPLRQRRHDFGYRTAI